MDEPTSSTQTGVPQLILVPSLITLAVTILRLVGERQGWPAILFSRAAGGGGALVGITWLPLIFGPYFALRLAKHQTAPLPVGRSFGFALLGLVVFFLGARIAFSPPLALSVRLAGGYLIIAVAAMLPVWGWPALGKVLLAYAYAARIPVAVVVYLALRGNWGTHYDALPAGYAGSTTLGARFLYGGLLPQLIYWIGYTVIAGSLLGIIALALPRRKKPPIVEPTKGLPGPPA
jgi:hypothetical protein